MAVRDHLEGVGVMLRVSSQRVAHLVVLAAIAMLAGCGHINPLVEDTLAPSYATAGAPAHVSSTAQWGETIVIPASETIEDGYGPYLLDSGDKLRIFVYGNPNLSRLYTVDHEGMIPVPLIGNVPARGKTTNALAHAIAARLAAKFLQDPHVTVDIAQNRPFFILGEVRSAGQYPYVSGLTVQGAIAIAGGYGDRANERQICITRRHNGLIEKLDVPPDYIVRPGDTIYVYERWL
jgi:polysaccharide export outer membrane protein